MSELLYVDSPNKGGLTVFSPGLSVHLCLPVLADRPGRHRCSRTGCLSWLAARPGQGAACFHLRSYTNSRKIRTNLGGVYPEPFDLAQDKLHADPELGEGEARSRRVRSSELIDADETLHK